jgi:hypothetical protein
VEFVPLMLAIIMLAHRSFLLMYGDREQESYDEYQCEDHENLLVLRSDIAKLTSVAREMIKTMRENILKRYTRSLAGYIVLLAILCVVPWRKRRQPSRRYHF